MDKVFLPKNKKWIYPPYPFTAAAASISEGTSVEEASVSERTASGEGPSGNVEVSSANSGDETLGAEADGLSGIETNLLDSEDYEDEGEPSLQLSAGEITLPEQVLKSEGGFQFEDVEPLVEETLQNIDGGNGIDFLDDTPGCSSDIKEGGGGRVDDAVSVSNELAEENSGTDVCSPPKPKRRRKSRKAESGGKEPVQEGVDGGTNSGGHWEDELRRNLEMTEEDFEEFTKSQGFDHQSSKLPSLFDFGVPDPRGMPRFATKIPDSYFERSNTLRVYQNILKPSYTSGTVMINATDLAFYKPECDKTVEPSGNEKVDSKEMIVTVECYHASPPVNSDFSVDLKNTRLPGISVRVEVLASQTLADLQTRLHCENDFVYMAEINHPQDAKRLDWHNCAGIYDRNTYETAVIFINETIYTSDVQPNYGTDISNWAGQKLLGNPEKLKTGLLSTKLSDTSFRPGYPYLYRHNICEHLLVFTNVRPVHPNDPQWLNSYPRVLDIYNLPPIRCRVNATHTAKFVVKDNPRLPESVVPLCTECCIKFCYTSDGRHSRPRSRDVKVGSFKLYPLIQKCMLPISNVTL